MNNTIISQENIKNLPLYNNLIRIRVLSTVIIVAFHCICPYGNWYEFSFINQPFIISCYSFIFNRIFVNTMLPTFFMISGILFYKKKNQYANKKNIFWKKFDRLIIPYSLIFLLCYYLNLSDIGIAQSNGHLWFVRELFFIFCFSIICLQIKEIYLLILGITLYIMFILVSKYNIQLPLPLLHVMRYYIFFIGGKYVGIYYSTIRHKKIQVILILLYLITQILNNQSIYTILFSVVIISLIPDNNVNNKIIISLNQCSFGIYLLHHILIFILFSFSSFHSFYAENLILAPIITCIITLSISWICTNYLKKVNFKYI